MNNIFEIDGVRPVIDSSSFIHPTASIIGYVIIGKNCYIGPHASLRGDFGKIILEDGVNFQDGCIAHCFPNGTTLLRKNVHISHGAVVHGCEIGENCMIGIQSVIMDNAILGKECMVAALSYVKPRFQAPDRSVLAGSPATIKRSVTDEEMQWKTQGTALYQSLAKRCLETLKPCEPLVKIKEQRQNLKTEGFEALK